MDSSRLQTGVNVNQTIPPNAKGQVFPRVLITEKKIFQRKLFSWWRPNLRLKLFLVSLSVLTIPWIGYEYLREMEVFLQQGQEHSLLATARAVAAVLHNRPELFQRHADLLRSAQAEREMFIPMLRSPIILDGQLEDWKPYLPQTRTYAADNVLESKATYNPRSLSFQQTLGTYERYLYAVFIVRDDKVVYRAPNSYRLDQCDHLQIALQGPDGKFYRYWLATQAPGWVNAHLMSDNPVNPLPVRPEVRIKGAWRETSEGYTIEMRIPMSMVGARIAFAVADVDNLETREIKTLIGTAGTRRVEELGVVIVPSPEIERILKELERGTNRTWVVDYNKRVLGLAGSLREEPLAREDTRKPTERWMHALYRLILPQPSTSFDDDLYGAARLEGQEIEMALSGTPQIRWRQSADRLTTILSAAHPVRTDDKVSGAVVVEETSNTILSLQNRALENLFTVTLVVFFSTTFIMLWFASRFSSRILKLRDEAERAIGPDGKVQGRITGSFVWDEVGDLARSFSVLLDRISQYTRYLESMAGRLSHELRTPLAVVRSSIENLEMQLLPEDLSIYVQRAHEGVSRLSSILASMSEASRLEQTLQRAETEDFNLSEVIAGCVEGYRGAYPSKKFTLDLPLGIARIRGVPELIAQMLDKLISNAVDFSTGAAPIQVHLTRGKSYVFLSVLDYGAPLPAHMTDSLFESMVSIRPQRNNEPHLGIGLYIVRIISEFHGGKVEASNLEDVQGARFTVYLPLKVP
ncbi:two-component system, OmpR family, sensor histidine kinase ChvG [Gammaproteobacteria bacterium]